MSNVNFCMNSNIFVAQRGKQKNIKAVYIKIGVKCEPITVAGGGQNTIYCNIIVVVLLFYVHDKQLRSCRDGQLT